MVSSRKRIISCFLVIVVLFAMCLPITALAQGTPTQSTQQSGAATSQSSPVSLNNCPSSVKSCVAGLADVFLSFFAFLLGISAMMMNFVIQYTIVDLRLNLAKVTAIPDVWAAIRDLINLSFIFILLFAAIRTILGLESPGKIIKNIILAALFINFSMFFTRVMIDASNSVALFFYDHLTTNNATTSVVNGLPDTKATSLVNAYVDPLRLQTLYNSADPTKVTSGDPGALVVDYSTIITVGILGSLMLALVAFVFLAVTIMFVIRYAALILILIFSPLGFISGELPMVGDYNKQWWDTLKSQLLFPPIFMLLTWVTLRAISGLGISTGSYRNLLAAGNVPSQDGIGLMINFLVVMVLIVMSLLISLETASKGSQALSGFYKKSTKWAGTAMFGTAGFLGRKTIGRAGYAIAQNETVKNWAAESRVGRLALLGADAAQKGSFDVRGSAFGGAFKDTTGIDAGKAGGTGGRAKFIEDQRKKTVERAKLLETNKLKKDELKAQLGEIAEEKKPVEESITELEKQKKVAEDSGGYKNALTEDTKLQRDLEQLDADIKRKNAELESAPTTGDLSQRFTVKAELDQMNQRKQTMSEQKKRSTATLASFGVEKMADDLKKLQEQKVEIETRTGEAKLKEEDKSIKRTEKERKRAYAKSLKETPASITIENQEIDKKLVEADERLVEKQNTLSRARVTGDKALEATTTKEIKDLNEAKEKLSRRKKQTSGARGFINKLTTVANMGVEGVAVRIATEGLIDTLNTNVNRMTKSTAGIRTSNIEASAEIRASVVEPSKEKKLADAATAILKDQDKGKDTKPDEKPDTGAPPTPPDGGTPPVA